MQNPAVSYKYGEAVLWKTWYQPSSVIFSCDTEVVWASFTQRTHDRISLVSLS